MKSIFFLLIAVVYFSNVNAQQFFTVNGSVRDIEGIELPGAEVYISGSRFAVITNSNGNYILSLFPGSYVLGVKMIGFKTKTIKIVISDKPEKIDFKLEEQVTSLAEVTIRSGPPNSKYLNQFIKLFIGTTPNAKSCRILNQEVLVFDYDKILSKLSASTTDFLIIENAALGYRIKYSIESFAYDEGNKNISYIGSSYFEELEGTVNQQKRWGLNRLNAYYGSPRHFFSSLYQGKIEKDGFFIARIINKPNKDRPADSVIKSNIKRFMLSKQTEEGLVDLKKGDSLNYWMKEKNKPLFFKELIMQQILADTLVHDTGNQFKKIMVKDQIYIAYTERSEDVSYKESLDPALRKVLNFPRSQVSMIKLLQDDVSFTSTGNLVDPQSVYFSGYWGWKNVADVLPSDYLPPAK